MRELILSLMNHRYPFGEAPCHASTQVEQIQIFADTKDLREKKTEMLKKNDVLTNAYFIKLLTVYQQNLELHYVYEYVPHTLASYISMKHDTDNHEIWNTTKRLFMKKITYELTILISYLAKMRIELDLKMDNLGLTEKEKLKVYMNAKCRMGHKTELSLINTYSQSKDRILNELHRYVQSLQRADYNPPHFKIDGNKLVFDQKGMSSSYLGSRNSSKHEDKWKEPGSAKFKRSMPKPKAARRKSSFADFKSDSSPDPKLKYQPAFRLSKPRQHQYKHRWEGLQNPYKSHIPQPHQNTQEQEGSPTDPTFSRSKQIRIQLQQKQNFNKNGERERKNSYKVKITSFREYEVDNCDPEQLFPSQWQSDEDVFVHFSRRAEQDEQERQERQEEEVAKRKQRKTTSETQNTLPPAPFYARQTTQTPLSDCTEQSYSSKELGVKVRAARERAVKLLSKMKTYKKCQ